MSCANGLLLRAEKGSQLWVNVFIARNGEILGDYPEERIAQMARDQQLQPDDHYWREGMEDWRPLPELVGPETWEAKPDSPRRRSRRTLPRAENVFIARAGEILGEYPKAQIKYMARNRQLQPEDHYWQEGMEDWLPLPELVGAKAWEPKPVAIPPPLEGPPLDRRLILSGVAALLLVGLLGFLILRSDRGGGEISTTPPVKPPLDRATELEMRDKAAADLRARIERLPATAKAPLHTFYYDVKVDMRKTYNRQNPFSATVHGWENVIDPATDQTKTRTDFVLTTDYKDGDWYFKHYRAVVTDLVNKSGRRIEEDESSGGQPSVVGLLGLKRRDAQNEPRATVPGFK